MVRYIVKRLVLFVPTLLIISVIIFFLSKISEEDVIIQKRERNAQKNNVESLEQQWLLVRKESKKLNFHLPRFFFSIYRRSSCDTLHLIPDSKIRENLEEFSYRAASWELTQQYYTELKRLLFSNNLNPNEKQQLLYIARGINPIIGFKEAGSSVRGIYFRPFLAAQVLTWKWVGMIATSLMAISVASASRS